MESSSLYKLTISLIPCTKFVLVMISGIVCDCISPFFSIAGDINLWNLPVTNNSHNVTLFGVILDGVRPFLVTKFIKHGIK